MNKRERYVEILYHRKNGVALLFPWVNISGVTFGCPCDAVELNPCRAADLGKNVVALLKKCGQANVDEMKVRWEAEQKVYFKSGTKAWSEMAQRSLRPTYRRLLQDYPAVAKGPATMLRQFVSAKLFERPGQKSRRLIRVEKSTYRSSTEERETIRLPITLIGKKLGDTILEFLASD